MRKASCSGLRRLENRPTLCPLRHSPDEAAADVVVVLLDHDQTSRDRESAPPRRGRPAAPTGTQSDVVSILADLVSPSGGPPRGGGRLANVLLSARS